MSDVLWQKVFQIAKNFGFQDDLVVIEYITKNRKKYKSKKRIASIQERWSARRQKRSLRRVLSALGEPKYPKKI